MSRDQSNDAISVKDLILKIGEYIAYLWEKKWWISLATILGVALFVYRVYDKPATYGGSMVITLNTADGGSSLGGMGSILGQIGLGGSGENKLIKVRALAQTYNVISNVLLDSVTILDNTDMVANHLLRIHQLNEKVLVKMNESFADFRFSHDSVAIFNPFEQRVLKYLYFYLRNPDDGLLEATEEAETGTITFELATQSPGLTIAIFDRLFQTLRETYINQSIAPQLRTLEELRFKADSIEKKLTNIEYQLASMQDRTIGLTSSRQLVEQANLQREANVLNGTYVEVLRNKESAEFMLKTAKPDLQIVESPILPLNYVGINYPFPLIYGAIFGGMISVIGFSLMKAYKDIMTPEISSDE